MAFLLDYKNWSKLNEQTYDLESAQNGDIIFVHPDANDNVLTLETDAYTPEGKHCVYRLRWKLKNGTPQIKFFKLLYSVLGENQVVERTFGHEVEVDSDGKQLLFKNKWKGDGVSYRDPFDGEEYYDRVYLKQGGYGYYRVEITGYDTAGNAAAHGTKLIHPRTSGNDACIEDK